MSDRILTDSYGLVRQQIVDWIKQRVCIKSDRLGDCRKLVLRHLSVDKKPNGDVQVFQITDEEIRGDNAENLVDNVTTAAQEDANNLRSGLQQYALYAFYANDKNFTPRKIFRVAADDESTDDVSPSEPPTEKGLVAQLMRHNEITMKNSMVSMGYMFGTFQRELSRLSDMNERYSQQQVDSVVILQEVLNQAHSRRLAEKRDEADFAFKEQLFESLKIALPIAINRLAGKPVVPEEDKSFLMMAAFLENLSPEQQTFFSEKLTTPQMSVLAEIFGEYERKKAAFNVSARPSIFSKRQVPGQGLPSDDGMRLPPIDGKPSEDPGKAPMKMFQSLRERIADNSDSQSEDDRLREFEQRAQQFMDRFKAPIPSDGR